MIEFATQESMVQSLKDAGCDKAEITHFLECRKGNKKQQELILLRKHRSLLLDKLHESQRQIDCLDYLIYQLQREEKGEK